MTLLSPLTRWWTLLKKIDIALRQVTVPLCTRLTPPVPPCVLTTLFARCRTLVARHRTPPTSVTLVEVPSFGTRDTPQIPLSSRVLHPDVTGMTRPTVRLFSMWFLTRTPPAQALYPILAWVLSLILAKMFTKLNTLRAVPLRQCLKTSGAEAL